MLEAPFHARLGPVAAVCVLALGLMLVCPAAVAAEPATVAAPDATEAPASPPAADPKEPAAEEAPPPAEAPPETPPGQKSMRLDDIKDLPLLKRYDVPFEKGEALLGDVADNTFGYDESAFWWMVRVVAQLPAKAFDSDKVTTGFSQLLALPSSFRGKPVTIRGAYVTCAPFEPPVLAIRKDVPTLYECNIRELPLERQLPIATVIVTEDPMDRLRVWDTVTVRGYFYKVRRYKGSQGEGLAPMLVAQRLVPEGPAPRGPSSTIDMGSSTLLLAIMIVAIGAMMAIFVWLKLKNRKAARAKRDRPVHRFHLRRPDRVDPPAGPGPGDEGGQPQP